MADAANTAQQGKTWFITGASSGFGRLLAEHVLSLGANVIATARHVDEITYLTQTRPGSYVVPLDVTNKDSIAHAVAQGLAYTGGVDVLVNNAGYGLCGAIEEASEDEYMPMFETNVFGLLNVTKSFLPHFRERRSGAIINLSSIGGLIGSAGWGYYNATKFAVEGLSEALHAEMAPLGVKVMVVEPGPFRTDFLGRSGKEAGLRLPDYETTVGQTREYFKTQAGRQPGDPQRAVEAMVEAISSPEPPKHLLLGKLALSRYREHLKQWTATLDKWQDLTTGADYPDGESSLTTSPYAESKA